MGHARKARFTVKEEITFDFGFGPVPAHQHPNGLGWVADTAHVDPSAYVGPNARVYGYARVSGSARVYGDAHVSGDARVSGDAHVSRTPLVLSGFEYTVTVCDAPYVCVGCQIATLEQWEAGHAPEECPRLESARPHLIALAKLHHAGDK